MLSNQRAVGFLGMVVSFGGGGVGIKRCVDVGLGRLDERRLQIARRTRVEVGVLTGGGDAGG